tara:strand:- start:152 stop:394 length:243 start_codon:yes stop_codon:yes gene_type:complete
MDKSKLFKIIPGVIALVVGFAAVMFFVIKLLWAWTIPDLFPGAVEQGLIASEISWFTSLKLALFLGVIKGATVSGSVKNN